MKLRRGSGVKIQQLDYYTGELIEEYDFIQDAAYDNFISTETLTRVLKLDGIVKTKKLKFKRVE